VAIRGPAEPDAFRLKRLKALRSTYALQGLLIHEVIENQIGQYQAGKAPDEEEAKARFARRIGQYRETAREMVTEFYHGHPEDAAFFDRMRDEGLAKISRFFAVIWPHLQDLMYLKHEEFDRFMLNNVAVTVKVDYVSRAGDGTIVLTDWKTGEDRDEYESDLQMGIYVLWAMQYYGSDPEGIRSWLALLLTGTMRSYSFSYEDLWRIKQTILDDFTAMNASSAIGAYPASPAPGKCMSCPFATVCPESRRGEYVAGKV